jgi:hypothetical protein
VVYVGKLFIAARMLVSIEMLSMASGALRNIEQKENCLAKVNSAEGMQWRDLTRVISIFYQRTLRQTCLGWESNPGRLGLRGAL